MKRVFNTSFHFDLRDCPFQESAEFVVFTGAPFSGKTSVLEAMNVPFEPEVARVFIEAELAKGRTKEEIRRDEAAFQRGLVDTKVVIENSRPNNVRHFFDRAIPDSITYYRLAGLDPTEILPLCKRRRYSHIFLFEPLPENLFDVRQDAVRTEDPELRNLLNEYLAKDYSALGYDVIRVPVGSIASRVEFIRARLENSGFSN